VREAVDTIARVRRQRGFAAPLAQRVTLLHCTSNYPTEPADVNLRAMLSLGSTFGLPVGYSDHTEGTAIGVAAAALGAVAIEKHFTLDRTLPGPDHRASLAPDGLRRMIEEIRAVEASLGDGVKAPRPTELPVRALVRRSVTLVHARRRGDRVDVTDLALLRPGTGIPPRELARVAGKRAARDLDAGVQLAWEDLVD
jgi:sialic acid synthase SpsE